MTETLETTTNPSGEPIDQLLDVVDELLGVDETLSAGEADFPVPSEPGTEHPDTPEATKDPAVRLVHAVDSLLSVATKLHDAETPGHWAEFTDGEAELAGAFDEDAISEDCAYAASFDNPDA